MVLVQKQLMLYIIIGFRGAGYSEKIDLKTDQNLS